MSVRPSLGVDSMNVLSIDKVFRINMPEELHKGTNLKKQRIKVFINVIDEKRANLYSLTSVILEIMKVYDKTPRYAPLLEVEVFSNENTYKFNIEWQEHFVNYLLKLARQVTF